MKSCIISPTAAVRVRRISCLIKVCMEIRECIGLLLPLFLCYTVYLTNAFREPKSTVFGKEQSKRLFFKLNNKE